MSSYGLVSLSGGSTILQVHALENGILAVPLFDAQHSLLELPLSGIGGFVGQLPLFLGSIVGEKIQLLCLVLTGDISLGQQFIGADAQPTNQQILVNDSVIESCYCF